MWHSQLQMVDHVIIQIMMLINSYDKKRGRLEIVGWSVGRETQNTRQ